MESFVTETRLNAERLQKAADAADMDEVAAVSHKMIPLFTLIGAYELGGGSLKLTGRLARVLLLQPGRGSGHCVRLLLSRTLSACRHGRIRISNYGISGRKHRRNIVFFFY